MELSNEEVFELFKNIIDNKYIYNHSNLSVEKFEELVDLLEDVIDNEGASEGYWSVNGYDYSCVSYRVFCNEFLTALDKYDNDLRNYMYKYLRNKTDELYFINKNKFNKTVFMSIFFNEREVLEFIDKLGFNYF